MSTTRIAASELRSQFSDVINRVGYGGERIVLERHGRDLVALVPIADLRFLEDIEAQQDKRDAEEYERMDATVKREDYIPWEEAKQQLAALEAEEPLRD